jgi:hypothetical protein
MVLVLECLLPVVIQLEMLVLQLLVLLLTLMIPLLAPVPTPQTTFDLPLPDLLNLGPLTLVVTTLDPSS